jgi:hypothetical protein
MWGVGEGEEGCYLLTVNDAKSRLSDVEAILSSVQPTAW